MATLALNGGTPAVQIPPPHYVWPRITPDVEAAVLAQLHTSISIYDRSGIFEKFEETFRVKVGKRFALLTSSGTAALHSCFEGLDLRPGDEVIVPAYTFFATVTPLAQYGVFIRQVDCDGNGNIDPSLISQHVTGGAVAEVVEIQGGVVSG